MYFGRMQICHSPASVAALCWNLETDTAITLTVPVPQCKGFYVASGVKHFASLIA